MSDKPTDISAEETQDVNTENAVEDVNLPLISEIIYGVVFTPTKIFSLFRFHQPWLKALMFVVAANILLTIFYFLGAEWEKVLTTLPKDMSAYLYPIRANMGIFIGIIFMPISLLFFIIYVSFMHFLSEAAGGHGQVLGLFSAFAFVQIIAVIHMLISFFTNFLGSYGNAIAAFLALVFFIWQITVYVIAIREIYTVSTFKAIILFFLPVIFGVGIMIFMIIAAIAFFAPLFGSINALTL